MSTQVSHFSRSEATPQSIQKLLDENGQLIRAIGENMNSKGKSMECIQYQQTLHRNLVYLASLADPTANVQAMLPPPGSSSLIQSQRAMGPQTTSSSIPPASIGHMTSQRQPQAQASMSSGASTTQHWNSAPQTQSQPNTMHQQTQHYHSPPGGQGPPMQYGGGGGAPSTTSGGAYGGMMWGAGQGGGQGGPSYGVQPPRPGMPRMNMAQEERRMQMMRLQQHERMRRMQQQQQPPMVSGGGGGGMGYTGPPLPSHSGGMMPGAPAGMSMPYSQAGTMNTPPNMPPGPMHM